MHEFVKNPSGKDKTFIATMFLPDFGHDQKIQVAETVVTEGPAVDGYYVEPSPISWRKAGEVDVGL